jgi:RNA-directed DNA polymerase
MQNTANGTEGSASWNAVDWRRAQEQVNNLRQRIFRASEEGNYRKVRNLQKLMLRSRSNALLAVRRVSQVNRGKDTPGVDMLVVKTPAARAKLVDELSHHQPWRVKPARRVYIPKANGKQRPLAFQP